MQTDEITAREQRVDVRDQLDAESLRAFRWQVRVEPKHRHLERTATGRDPRTDFSEADQADGLAVQLDADKRGTLPAPRTDQRGMRHRHVTGEGQQQRESVLDRRDGVAGRGVEHRHPTAGGRRHVDVVDPDAGPADHLEARRGLQQLGRNARPAAHDPALHIGYRLVQAITLERSVDLHLETPAREQVDRLRIDLVADQNFHWPALTPGYRIVSTILSARDISCVACQ